MGSILKGFGLNGSEHRRHRPTLFDRHPGQAIVLIAVLMVVLIGFTGLAVDGGELYFLQKNVQNAADAAVLAGLYEICSDPSRTLIEDHVLAVSAATQAINDNGFYDGVDGTTITFIHPANPTTVDPNDAGAGMTSNYFVVDITAKKPARLIQLVYQGPLQVTVRSAGKCTPVAEWTQGKALFGVGPCTQNAKESVQFNGSNVNIVGGVFGNGAVDMNPGGGNNGGNVDGGVGSAGTTNDHNKFTYTNPNSPPSNNQSQITVPHFWDIGRFQPGGKTMLWANGKNAYFYYAGTDNATKWTDFNDGGYGIATDPPADGIYYSAGGIKIASNDTKDRDLNGLTFVAAGKIELSSNDNNAMVPYNVPFAEIVTAGYNVLPLAFTEWTEPGSAPSCDDDTDAINIGTKFAFLGVLYAPNGQCVFTGAAGITAQGSIMCYKVNLSGSSFTLTYDPDQFPPPPPSVGVTG